MAFSRAKRFNYKIADKTPSPADYVVTSELEKGCRIPRSARFTEKTEHRIYKATCPRLSNIQSGLRNLAGSSKSDMNFKANISEFNRNDIRRASVRRNRASNIKNFLETEEYIDDDYHSLTSSDELNELRRLGEYEFQEMCKEYRRLRRLNSKDIYDLHFQETVLKKLQNIENTTENVRDEVDAISDKVFFQNLDKLETAERDTMVIRSLKASSPKIRDIIAIAISNLAAELKQKRMQNFENVETNFKKAISEMYKTNEKQSKEIKMLCNDTMKQLANNLEMVLKDNKIPALEYFFEQLPNNSHVDMKNTSDSDEYFEDDIDFSLNIENSQEILHIQGNILELMKQELADLKQVLYTN